MLPLWDRVDLGAMPSKSTPHSPKLQHYWSLTIRLFSVISRRDVGGSYHSAEMQSVYSTASANWVTGTFWLHLLRVWRPLQPFLWWPYFWHFKLIRGDGNIWFLLLWLFHIDWKLECMHSYEFPPRPFQLLFFCSLWHLSFPRLHLFLLKKPRTALWPQ